MQPSVDNTYAILRHRIAIEPRLPQPRSPMVFPVVPRADEVFAVEAAVSERTAGVVADPREGAEFTIPVRDDDPRGSDFRCSQRPLRELLDRAEVAPV